MNLSARAEQYLVDLIFLARRERRTHRRGVIAAGLDHAHLRGRARVLVIDQNAQRFHTARKIIPNRARKDQQQRIGGRWYSDGGLLNPLPVWAAVELGATHIVALHALPQIPSILLRPFVKGFRRTLGHNPPLPPQVELTLISTGDAIGSMRDALRWKRENVDRWLQMGYAAAQNISLPKCYGRDCIGPSLER